MFDQHRSTGSVRPLTRRELRARLHLEHLFRHRRKIQHARRVGLKKLWDFIMRIVATTTMPWRIVIGRLGRLGHGELKSRFLVFGSSRQWLTSDLGWGIILSKKNLVRCAALIRDSCPMCHILRCHDQPVILSACLISMETHPSLTILPESLELGEMRGTQAPTNNATNMQNTGQVLDDVSVTHILTLPTSAFVQHVQTMPRPTIIVRLATMKMICLVNYSKISILKVHRMKRSTTSLLPLPWTWNSRPTMGSTSITTAAPMVYPVDSTIVSDIYRTRRTTTMEVTRTEHQRMETITNRIPTNTSNMKST